MSGWVGGWEWGRVGESGWEGAGVGVWIKKGQDRVGVR